MFDVTLTFDNGPEPDVTPRVLDILKAHDIKSTFFVIGEKLADPARRRLAVRAHHEGHWIGNHTFTHPHLAVSGAVETRNQLEECQRAVEEATGESPRLFRPPFGGRRPHTLRIARSLGLDTIMWNVTSWDWKAPPAAKIVGTCTRQMRGGDVILMHDGSHIAMGADRWQTVVATHLLIESWRAKGYEFVTVPEMMGAVGGRQVSVIS